MVFYLKLYKVKLIQKLGDGMERYGLKMNVGQLKDTKTVNDKVL